MKKILFILYICLFFSFSCSNFVNKIHKQMDRDTTTKQNSNSGDKFDIYRKNPSQNLDNRKLTSRKLRRVPPQIKRNYRPIQEVQKRYTAADLTDTSNSGSLWAGAGKDGHLFSSERKKQNGDIIVINVHKDLKDKIAIELRRAFPPEPTKNKTPKKPAEQAEQTTPETATANAAPNQPNATTNNDDADVVHDRISGVVIEQINKNHLLLRGQKDLIYRNAKRTVELQALISRNSISTDDTLNSNHILESQIKVIR